MRTCLKMDRLHFSVACLFVLASVTMTKGSWAQGFFRPISGAQSGRFIEAPRGMLQQLREAERAIESQSYSDAVVRLGDLLQRDSRANDENGLGGQDFFLDADEATNGTTLFKESLFRRARDIVGSLPSQARETYQLRYGPLSRKMLGDAAATRDWKAVAAVRRMYFHTDAGYEASLLLAKREFYGGHALAASMLLDDIVTVPAAISHLGESVHLLYAATCHASGRDVAEFDWKGASVTIDGKSETIASADEWKSWLEKHLLNRDAIERNDADYPIFGGEPNRNELSQGEMPLENERWLLDTTASPRQGRTLREVSSSLASSGKLPPPSWTPIRVGDQVLMRTTERLVGVDYLSGKRIWMYPWFSPHQSHQSNEIEFDAIPGEDDAADLLTQRVWNDLPYGEISSDGKRVFMVDDLGEVEMASFSPIMGMRGTRPADSSSNTLVALDLATEGKLLWRLGKGESTASTLSDAFFLGPPLPLDGRLYSLVEIAGDILLVCLDPATGEELWRQHLTAVETGGVDTDPVRRVAGATPTFHEGVLICPTGAGAMVAIDLVDRMFRWGTIFNRNDDFARNMAGRGRGVETVPLMQRWHNGTAIAADQTLLVTPIESDRLYGFDLVSGEALFSEKNRITMRYLAGIRDGKFFLVGTNQMSAYDAQTGTNVWTTTSDLLTVGQNISGRGVFGEGYYLLPTTSNEIIKVSLSDGSALDRRQLRFPLGNLVAAQGELMSHSPTSLAVAYGEASLGPKIEQALARNPEDIQALIHKAELLIQRGQRDEALTLLARAREQEPDNDEALMLSVAAMLDSLRESPEVDGGLVETLDKLIYQPEQRVELLALRVRAALQAEKHEDAAKYMLELSNVVTSEPASEDAINRIVSDAGRQCSLDAWLAARSAELASQTGAKDRERVNRIFADSFADKLHSPNNLLWRLLQQFGSVTGSDPIRNELSTRFEKEQEWLRAYSLQLGNRLATDAQLESLPTDRLFRLAKIYARSGFAKDAIHILEQLRGREDGPELAMLDELEAATLPLITTPEWSDSASLKWEPRPSRTRATMSLKQQVSETTILAGREFQGWRLVSEGAFALALRNPHGYPRGIPLDLENRQRDMGQNEAKISGGVMVVVTPNALVAIDLHRLDSQANESVLWRHSLSSDDSPLLKRRSSPTRFGDQVFQYLINGATARTPVPTFNLGPILGDRVLALQGGELMSLDLFTSETQWRNSDAPVSGVVLCDGKQIAVVSDSEKRMVFYDLHDGAKRGETPWTHGQIWTAQGEHVLAYQPTTTSREYEIRLINPFTNDIKLSKRAAEANRTNENIPASYGRIVGGRYFSLLDTAGNATLWDLMDATEISSLQLPAYPDLIGLHAMRLEDKFFLLPMRRPKPNELPSSSQLHTREGNDHETTNALFTISLGDGTLLWQKEFEEAWGCTIHQPDSTPAVLLTRGRSTFRNPPVRTRTLDFVAFDVDDGHEVASVLDKDVPSHTNELETQTKIPPGQDLVIVDIGIEKLQLNYKLNDIGDETDGVPDAKPNIDTNELR
ncbi:PQQ enzyme repeat protein [Novipirellula galeiformis]|uniref:PQQ enzyme repeat protein n=1 Tax=Novipirellula galeiformis TaxID=2528004 RepID=A0A5C6CRK3_9BACT|nr:PQQ-binding-like beta-propeller repeat protein [Novipirellula galeiformis]TWU27112.1 PQQ enzyme repeat protein [Novipirellula galeiformis]